MTNARIIKFALLIAFLAGVHLASAQDYYLGTQTTKQVNDFQGTKIVPKDLQLKAGTTGRILPGDEIYKMIFESKDLVLEYTVKSTTTVPAPTAKTIQAESFGAGSSKVTASGTIMVPGGDGGVAVYPGQDLTGMKTIAFTYALAPGLPIATVIVKLGTTIVATVVLPATASWGDYRTSLRFPLIASGKGDLSLTFNRGLNLDYFVIIP